MEKYILLFMLFLFPCNKQTELPRQGDPHANYKVTVQFFYYEDLSPDCKYNPEDHCFNTHYSWCSDPCFTLKFNTKIYYRNSIEECRLIAKQLDYWHKQQQPKSEEYFDIWFHERFRPRLKIKNRYTNTYIYFQQKQ